MVSFHMIFPDPNFPTTDVADRHIIPVTPNSLQILLFFLDYRDFLVLMYQYSEPEGSTKIH